MPKNPVLGTRILKGRTLDELIISVWDWRYSCTAVDLPAGTYKMGQLLANETQATSSAIGFQPAFSDVLCLEDVVVPTGETREVNALVRGPALVNLDALVRIAGTGPDSLETDAELKIRVNDLLLQLVRFVKEPTVQSTPDLQA